MILLFASAMFMSALLLFWVQPLFTKAVLPLLGGTPAVWNTALVFFQAALLAGYLYAHVSSRWLPYRRQPVVHMALLAVAALVLPIGTPEGWQPPASGAHVVWLLGLLAVGLGPPFFALSGTAPLLQRWFSMTDSRFAGDPYFLYAASNLGSMGALIGYPLLLEPGIGLEAQHELWSGLYLGVAMLIGASAWAAKRRTGVERTAATGRAESRPPSPSTRARWVLLALAPSSLLLGVTTYITTDVAAVPLLWVLPLALYLLTFVLAFSRRSLIPHAWMLRAMPYAAIALTTVLCISVYGRLPLPVLFLHLLVFFVLAMVCHGELARSRPPVEHLTEFYLWIALGGVLGGSLNALVAPLVFDSVIEYPLALVLAVSLAPVAGRERLGWGDLAWPAAVLALSAGLLSAVDPQGSGPPAAVIVFLIVIALVVFAFRHRPPRLGLALGALLLVFFSLGLDQSVLTRERSFFGVNAVLADPTGTYHLLRHGTTIHGAQEMTSEGLPEPISYYVEEGPVGDVFARLVDGHRVHRVAGIGLGTGSIACYRTQGQEWTFYEIDPTVEQIARDVVYFSYLSACAPEAHVVLGDGRLSLRRAEQFYDLIIVDVFSSDAIPVHMMTREAFDIYLDRLSPNGLILMNISNSFLRLQPVIAAIAADLGLAGRVRRFRPDDAIEAARAHRYPSEWVVVARDDQRLAALDGVEGWEGLEAHGTAPWTDDYSNIVQALRWGVR